MAPWCKLQMSHLLQVGALYSVYDRGMSLFEKLKGRVADKLAEQAAKQGKAVARKSAEAALSAAKSAGRKLEEAIFGARDELPLNDDAPKSTDSRAERRRKEEARKRKEEEVGERLRAADRRVKERDAREGAKAQELGAKPPRLEEDVDREIAALRKKLER